MEETYTVPVVVKNEDGSCLVAFPDGLQLVATGIDAAHEILDHYLEPHETLKRRIGFTVFDDEGNPYVV
tara:strand:+ start:713 stop:919 length:207 start_codon:yes stop_codon:yes gene_type:complete